VRVRAEASIMNVLIFDTETTGFILKGADPGHPDQPDLVQLAALLCDESGREFSALSTIVVPGKPIHRGARQAHGISDELADAVGVPPLAALSMFKAMLLRADMIVAHNLEFDAKVMLTAWTRVFGSDFRNELNGKRAFCTMKAMTPVCQILHSSPRHAKDFKWPKLEECVEFLFGEKLIGAHDALVDARACARVYFELKARREETRLLTEEVP